jgi:hypothetical protein
MTKRTILLGEYNTAVTGLWTLAAWNLSPAVYKTNIIEVPASDVVLDLSTSLTDGEPRYSPRTLTVTLESSEGDRLARKRRIAEMINQLNGQRVQIKLPDDDRHYLVGRLSIQELYNDPAHASVQVDAVCEPWLYSDEETTHTLLAASEEKGATIVNSGRRSVVPIIEVTGGDIWVRHLPATASWTLSPGVYQIPDIYLTPGTHRVRYRGEGQLVIRYREAVLA